MKKNFSICWLFLFLFFILTNLADAAPIKVQGVVKDSLSKEVLSYASLGLKKYPIGTCTNMNGEFQLIVNDTLANEMITVSMMGYESKSYKISEMKSIYFEILLNPRSIQLGEITVSPDQLTGEELLKKVIKNHNKNYPSGFCYYETFFRDLVTDDAKEAKIKNCRLTEAAVNIVEFGLDASRDQKFKIHEIRNSYNYVETSFWSRAFILKIKNPLEQVYDFKNIISKEVLKKYLEDECYSKRILDKTYLDDTPTYVLELRQSCAKFLGFTNNDLQLYRITTMYVNSNNWAIEEAEYKFINESEIGDSVLYKVNIRMQEYDHKYYLKLINFGGYITDEYAKIGKGVDYKHYSTLLVNSVILERKSIERIRRRNEMKSDLPLWDAQYTYNPEFWENYTILLDKPLNSSVTKDLEREETLKNQFKDGGLKNAKK